MKVIPLRHPEDAKTLKIPAMQSDNSYSCGLDVAYSLCLFFGKDSNLRHIRKVLKTSYEGTYMRT